MGARNSDIDFGEIGRDALRPRILPSAWIGGARSQAPFLQRSRTSSASASAALPSTTAWTSWYGAIGLAGGIDPIRIVKAMMGAVPAADGHILPAGKGDRIIHHHDLLVVRCASRQVVVQAIVECGAGVRQPSETRGKWLALERHRASNGPKPGDAHGGCGRSLRAAP